jgi:anhydro-N-acetylmuramic acid kinase
MAELYVGLMSGTSLDGIDAVLVDFSVAKPVLLCSHSLKLGSALTQALQKLCDEQQKTDEINLMGRTDRLVAQRFSTAVIELCQKANVKPEQITAIGSHGQTIRHYPDTALGFSLQIGDANTIAVITGIDVVADFRKKDIALGGQGAPLVPAFHQYTFADTKHDRIIVNIGGMANLTYLPATNPDNICGHDTGPGNTLLDRWIQTNKQQPYDNNGQWARSGKLNQQLLQHMLADEYFSQPAPKSTGREKFNLTWLADFIADSHIPAQDIQHTLVQLSAHSIAQEIKSIATSGDIYLCGGGSHNSLLVEAITAQLPQFKIDNTAALGVDPDWVEAIAFAWLAHAHIHKIHANVPNVTGASRSAVLGCFYPSQ